MKDKILAVFTFFSNLINKGHDRSVKAKKNIIASFFIKGISIAISLILVPLTINYINPSRYGIWLTLSSIVGWFSFFDIGLTPDHRYKFAVAKAKGEDNPAQIYLSNTYAILSIIFFLVWMLFLLANHFLNWTNILSISESMQSEIPKSAVMVFTYFCLQFVLRIITTLIIGDRQREKSSFVDVLGQIVSLSLILILIKATQGSFVTLGLGLCISPRLVLIAANIYFFSTSFKNYLPSFSKLNPRMQKDFLI